ncbi:MAG TPA: hypothetical protein VE890_01525 [Thermoguttaceae bacterium]|nr:hypothetical protein [Thermoguttaceae bacterium]
MREYFERCLLACVVVLSASLASHSDGPQAQAGTPPPAIVPEQHASPIAKAPLTRTSYRVELADPVSPSMPARTYDVVLSKDPNGFPVEYALTFEPHVCSDGQCKVVEVTLVWNAPGFFERLECRPGGPLTKKDHVPFSHEDYAKLDRILKERSSILRSWTLAYLQRPTETGDQIDAVTTATPTTVRDSVIQDAAFTTWALWHWANGQIVPQLQRITRQNATAAYLNHLLVCSDRRFADFAMDCVTEHHPSDPQFVDSVFQLLETGERDQITQSLAYLRRAIPDQQTRHTRLIDSCGRMRSADFPMILQEFAAEEDLPATTIEQLTGHLSQLPYYPIHLILRMLEARKFASEKTLCDVAALLQSDDFFIARRAYEHLAKQDLDVDMRNRLDTFRERNRDRL